MSFRLERLLTPYEFEDRATFFIKAVGNLAANYPLLLVEAENKTIEDLRNNSVALKHFTNKNPSKTVSIWRTGHRMEIDSANENKVLVAVFSDKKKMITSFQMNADKLALNFSGKRTNGNDIIDSGHTEFRYFQGLIYSFK
jgi:hypothetical protein